ncbi:MULTISPECIES: hypothetical protein [Pseudomonas]|uniref:Uncharacterized protein n=1 Tax=Pseudomonas brassicacearum (strain NFM421) TaxID=994484 RepID=F2KLT4_PSEBN|nr:MULTISPECIES: hypothetical protein [Pseudomonas]EIK57526.1 hypothetical protein PflQ8_5179 [Pseudomonas fluorescens Q8r1-96]KIR15426.1 hypothetical protein PFLU4_36550 [Pseudomonas fluorescens]AEA71477.1 Conserved hypothetical protein [Pseudomonas brassicacearum subsp. brassicacearum NFM421]ALQ06004.1 hypothetical protein AK973_5555 [Pseudomonas brassicacearum]AOS40930.1 hypothetical protein A0U95_19780 [Pseudomonas brassicacearum]
MLRIRGTVGDWPVDLSIEMDEGDWAQLGAQLQVAKSEGVAVPATKPVANPVSQDDAQWQIAKELLRKAGQLSGPDLLEQLEGLSGSASAGKRLLVRLRHCAEVKVLSGADTPLYSWVGAEA